MVVGSGITLKLNVLPDSCGDAAFDLLSPQEKAQFLKTFIQRITYSLEKVRTRW